MAKCLCKRMYESTHTQADTKLGMLVVDLRRAKVVESIVRQ